MTVPGPSVPGPPL